MLTQAQPKGVSHPDEADLSLRLMSFRKEFTVGNTVRKILHHIREEYNAVHPAPANPKSGRSISNFILMGQPKQNITHTRTDVTHENMTGDTEANEGDSSAQGLKPVLMEAVQDVLDELETVYDNISKNAKDHIHSEYVSISLSISSSLIFICRTAKLF